MFAMTFVACALSDLAQSPVMADRGSIIVKATGQAGTPPVLQEGIEQLRLTHGNWAVVTEFLNPDGSIAKSVEGTYRFTWVVMDRVLTIAMVSVGAEGTLRVMTGPADGKTRTPPPVRGAEGKDTQLRFTRFNVKPDNFESKMEYSTNGGATWLPGNHQRFRRTL